MCVRWGEASWAGRGLGYLPGRVSAGRLGIKEHCRHLLVKVNASKIKRESHAQDQMRGLCCVGATGMSGGQGRAGLWAEAGGPETPP